MKPIPLLRKLTITGTSYGGGNWTLTTSGNHYIGVGDTFAFTSIGRSPSDPVPQLINATCIAGTATNQIIFTEVAGITIPNEIYVSNFGTGYNSSLDFTFQHGSTYNGVIHVVSHGTATSAGAQGFGSIDGVHWVSLAASSALTAGSQVEIAVTKPYVYGRITIATTASAGGGTNAVKVWKAGC